MKKYINGKLENGMKYIYIPNPNIMTFTLIIAFKVGSRDEGNDANGYSHLLEHMLFKGTTRRPKAKDISQEFELLGGSFNATTSRCITNYYIKAPDENFEKCMDLLFDITFNSIIRSVDLEMEKKVVVEEFNKMMDNPMSTSVELCMKEVFENHPLGNSTIGTKEAILGFDRNKVYEYYKKYYTPSNCTVSISGNIGNINDDKLKKLLKKYTNICKEKDSKTGKKIICQNITSNLKNPKQSILLNPQEAPKIKVETRNNTQQCAIMIGYPSANRYNLNDIYALSIAASILGGGLSSRLFNEVREKAGLAYTISAENTSFQDSGIFAIVTAIEKNSLLFNNIDENKVDIKNISETHDRGVKSDTVISQKSKNSKGGLEIILKVMEDILRDGITEDELLLSKTNIVNKLAMSYENTHTIAMYYNEMLMMEQSPIVTINDFIKGIKKMKIKQVNEVIRKYLSFEKMTICIVGNYTEKQIVEHLSKQF